MSTITGVVTNGVVVPNLPLPEGGHVEIRLRPGRPDGEIFAGTRVAPADLRPMPREERFRQLVGQWKEETRFLSSIHDMISLPAYLEIVGMGKEALPLLFDELRREPDHWFAALQAITGINPIPPTVRGDVDEMTRAWLTWAQQHGL